MPRRSGSQRGKADHPPTADRDRVDPEAGSRESNPRGEIAGRSAPSQASADAKRQASGSEPRRAGIALAPWRRFPAADAATVVLLLIATTLAWCSANAKWTPRAWSRPTAYLEPANTDMFFHLAYLKAAAEGQLLPFAWKSVNELGAPYDANWSDWPLIEELQHTFLGLLARVFGLFAGLNLGLLIGNLLATAVSYAVCRASGCNRTWSAVAGLAFGLAPYAFAQSPHHITCEYVWHIPLFLLVWKWAATEGGLAPWTPRFWGAVGVGFLAGLQNVYYTNILCQLTLLGAAVVYCRDRSKPALLSACAVVAAAACAFALMNVDTWSYRFAHGPNPDALTREYRWMELYALKPVEMGVPPVTHRSRALADFAAAHRAAARLPEEGGSYLGMAGLAALALLVGRAVSGVVRRTSAVPMEAWQVLWIVLCFSTGGLNAILGSFGFTYFRTGSRYSVVILAIVLVYAAQRLTALQARIEGKDRDVTARMLFQAAAAGACLLIFWDQAPRPPKAEQTATIARQMEADRQFVAQMEEALPEGAMVFQLPLMEFPESPSSGLPSYDHFRPYLYSRSLRFSFGSVKGRDREKWQQQLAQVPLEKALQDVKDRGFAAIYVNRNGLTDRGKEIEDTLLRMGYMTPPLSGASGDLACFLLEKK